MTATQSEQPHYEANELPEVTNLSFLLRPPVTAEEIRDATPHIHDVINSAYDVYESKGIASLVQYLSEKNSSKREQDMPRRTDDCNGEDCENDDDDDAKITSDPRAYQAMMVERAKKQNTIVQLNTGLGKTLIAILTIKHFAEDYKAVNSEGLAKQTWFLVPSVALAIQQSHTLRVNLPYKVAVVCHTGKSKSNSISKKQK